MTGEPVYILRYADWQIPDLIKQFDMTPEMVERIVPVGSDTVLPDPIPIGTFYSKMRLNAKEGQPYIPMRDEYELLAPVMRMFEERGIFVPLDSVVRELKGDS